ncbi:hypothetical protein SprV_0200786100 [Sparganum proliferum]
MGTCRSATTRLPRAYLGRPTDVNKADFYQCGRLAQQWSREMQDAWMTRKTEEVQGYVDRNETKNYFKAIKTIYGSPNKVTAPLLSSDKSTLLTEKSQVLKRRTEHFRSVLNRPSTIAVAALERFPQVEINIDLDLPHYF